MRALPGRDVLQLANFLQSLHSVKGSDRDEARDCTDQNRMILLLLGVMENFERMLRVGELRQ